MLNKEYFTKNKAKFFLLAFLAVLALGIFFRTYNFQNWLRFNTDQARDANLVGNYLESKTSVPLLGPKAGGTDFKLGPAFYYFQIFSAKIFGSEPSKLAYPDLIFSVLSILLMYFLMKKYFNRYLSFVLAGLFSISMFAVHYSRFAWNPNSSPFFVLLFLCAFLALADDREKRKMLWSILAGISLGIGVQLHTLLLIVMPIVAVIFLVYLYKSKKIAWQQVAIVLAVAFVLNAPQIFSEYKNHGVNTIAFFVGIFQKTGSRLSLTEKVYENSLCQIQGNLYVISSLGPSDECGVSQIFGQLKRHKQIEKKLPIIFETILGIVFTFVGFLFWVKFYGKEENENKKNFLAFLGVYFIIMFVVLIPMSEEISLRFYLAMEFIPFLLLGFWIKALAEYVKNKKMLVVIFLAIFVLLVVGNVYAMSNAFTAVSAGENVSNDDSDSFITLSETKFLADYIASHTGQGGVAYLEGRQSYIFKYLRPIKYFTDRENITLREYSKDSKVEYGEKIFMLDNSKNKARLDSSMRDKYITRDSQVFGRFYIAVFEEK